MIKTIKLDVYIPSATGDTGLDKIAKALKERSKDKKSFWGPIAEKTLGTAKKEGLISGGIDFAFGSSKTFSEFKSEITRGTSHWFAPVAESYEKYGRELTKNIGKKLRIKVIE